MDRFQELLLCEGCQVSAAVGIFGADLTGLKNRTNCMAVSRSSSARRWAFALSRLTPQSFMFVLVLRFSAIPGHITTAVSSTELWEASDPRFPPLQEPTFGPTLPLHS